MLESRKNKIKALSKNNMEILIHLKILQGTRLKINKTQDILIKRKLKTIIILKPNAKTMATINYIYTTDD